MGNAFHQLWEGREERHISGVSATTNPFPLHSLPPFLLEQGQKRRARYIYFISILHCTYLLLYWALNTSRASIKVTLYTISIFVGLIIGLMLLGVQYYLWPVVSFLWLFYFTCSYNVHILAWHIPWHYKVDFVDFINNKHNASLTTLGH